jgi:hypothetical protein
MVFLKTTLLTPLRDKPNTISQFLLNLIYATLSSFYIESYNFI